MNASQKNLIKTIIKAVLSVGLIAFFFIFGKIDFKGILNNLESINPAWFLLAASLHLIGLFLSATRWKQLLKAQDIDVRLFKLFKFYLVGGFFNTFLPGRIGGDFMRIYDTARIKKSGIEPFAVILIERGSGMLTLISLAAIVMLFNLDVGFDTSAYRWRFWASFLFLMGAGFGLIMLLKPSIAHFFLRIFDYSFLKRFKEKAFRMYSAIMLYREKPGYLAKALLAGFFLQINYIMHYFFIAKALHFEHITIPFFFFAIPIRAVLLMVPLFINGIGLRESLDIFFFANIGLSANDAVAFSWLSLFLVLCYAVIGGLVYTFRQKVTE